jgi:hypothetical protein
MQDGSSIVNLGELSKPVNTLIEKISDAVGGIFAPIQIKRKAKAEAEADKIKAISSAETSKLLAMTDIEIKDLQNRAMYRFISEETRKQINIESIAEKSFKDINDTAKPENMENDWISNFFDKCKLISNEEMQTLWAKVLAGEANNPGSYSKRTLEFMATMDKYDAEMFQNICSFRWFINSKVVLIYDTEDDIYKKNGVSFSVLKHLDSIGLISFGEISGYKRLRLGEILNSSYHKTPIVLKYLEKKSDNEMDIGKVLLTQIGEEFLNIINSKPIPEFIDYVISNWGSQGIATYSLYPKIEVPIDSFYEVGVNTLVTVKIHKK